MDARHQNWIGMNWIRQEKRLAIYLRDGLECVYCGKGVEDGATLTLDHIRPCRGEKGDHRESNLVTCCKECNNARGAMRLHKFTSPETRAYIHRQARKRIPLEYAKSLIARRGSAKRAIASMAA